MLVSVPGCSSRRIKNDAADDANDGQGNNGSCADYDDFGGVDHDTTGGDDDDGDDDDDDDDDKDDDGHGC